MTGPSSRWSIPELDVAVEQLERVHAEMCRHDADASEAIALVSPAQRNSARNLVHYLALRRADLRALQAVLAKHGLSSLGRLESHAGSAVEAVLGALYALRQQPERVSWLGAVPDFAEGAQLLTRHAAALFGPPPMARPVRIMVTMPSEAAGDYALVRKLLQRGMDCMRVNCAHDDEAAWMLMVEHLERARLEIGRPCAVQMDLAGPKIRTSEIEPGPAVLKVKPVRDRLGAVVRPAVLGLVAVGAATPAVVGIDVSVLPVDRVPAAAPGDRLWFEDARGRRRSMRVRP